MKTNVPSYAYERGLTVIRLSLSLFLRSSPFRDLVASLSFIRRKARLSLSRYPFSVFCRQLPSRSRAGNVPTPGNGALAAAPGLTVRQVREYGDWSSRTKRRADWPIPRFCRYGALISFTVGALLLSSTYLSRTDGWPRNSRRTFHETLRRIAPLSPSALLVAQ